MRKSDPFVPASEDVRGNIAAVFSHFLKTSDNFAIDPQTTIESFARNYHIPNKASLSTIVNFQQNVSKWCLRNLKKPCINVGVVVLVIVIVILNDSNCDCYSE